MALLPRLNLFRLVCGTVVQDDVNFVVCLERLHATIHEVHEREKLLRAMSRSRPADHLSARYVERCVEARCAMPDVVVRVPFGLARPQLQKRLGMIQRLYLSLFVD